MEEVRFEEVLTSEGVLECVHEPQAQLLEEVRSGEIADALTSEGVRECVHEPQTQFLERGKGDIGQVVEAVDEPKAVGSTPAGKRPRWADEVDSDTELAVGTRALDCDETLEVAFLEAEHLEQEHGMGC